MSCIILKYDDQIRVKQPERPSNVIEQVVLVYTNLFQFDCEASNVCLCKSRSILSLNQPVLSNEGKVSCSRKQWEPLMGLELTSLTGIHLLQVIGATHCAMPPLYKWS